MWATQLLQSVLLTLSHVRAHDFIKEMEAHHQDCCYFSNITKLSPHSSHTEKGEGQRSESATVDNTTGGCLLGHWNLRHFTVKLKLRIVS